MKSIKVLACLLGSFALAALALPSAASAAVITPALEAKLSSLPPTDSLGVVIVAFAGDSGLGESQLDALRAVGLTGGRTLAHLNMVAVNATVAQVLKLAGNPAVRSIRTNDRLTYYMHQARVLTGVERLQTDATLTAANGGLPVSGRGDFSVVINDSGIDATHADLQLGEHVVQNVQMVSLDDVEYLAPGFQPLVFAEDVPDTDTHIGHGTHCAGIVGGSGVRSGALYRGVAPGAKLIGVGSGAVQYILGGLGGFEWTLANQARYGIRIISNSWGGAGEFDPDDPIVIATKRAFEHNIVVVFAAGNEGPAPNTHNFYARAPWVISVAAGTKEGGLASFSSRGTPKAGRLADADPNNDFNAPTLTAPGTGREFESNAAKFTAAIVSTRSTTNVVANGLTSDAELPVAHIPFYTQIEGTSMACPHIAGVVALMLDANPALSAAQVKQILVETATPMPGYAEWEAGAGYVNAFAAVDKAFNAAHSYPALAQTSYRAQVTISADPEETFLVEYNPTNDAGPDGPNAYHFTVGPDIEQLEVTIDYAYALTAATGNILLLRLYSPDGRTYTGTGTVVFVTDEPRRYVKVVNPTPGAWSAEVRGFRGISSVPQATLPVGLAFPDEVHGSIQRTRYTLGAVPDIRGHAYESEIVSALKFRYLDIFADGTFKPGRLVTRGDFAQVLANNTPLRHAVGAPNFSDAPASAQALYRAVAAKGSTLRHFTFDVGALLATTGTQFKPGANLTRLEAAVAFVRALGQDAEARALAGSIVTVTNQNGETIALTDNPSIPADLRGYVQLALNKALLAPQFTAVRAAKFNPGNSLSRAELAESLNSFRDAFSLE